MFSFCVIFALGENTELRLNTLGVHSTSLVKPLTRKDISENRRNQTLDQETSGARSNFRRPVGVRVATVDRTNWWGTSGLLFKVDLQVPTTTINRLHSLDGAT